MQILLAEDDPLLGAGLQAALDKAGFRVTWEKDSEAALQRALGAGVDAVVLDLGLPGIGGMEVLRRLRTARRDLPVLILTARDSTAHKVAGLEAGADDYLTKSAELDELIARLRVLLRRAGRTRHTVGELTLDPATRQVTLRGRPVALARREFDVLWQLAEAGGRVLTRAQLEAAVYGTQRAVESNAIEVHVHHLRAKIGTDLLKTVRGVGYALVSPSP